MRETPSVGTSPQADTKHLETDGAVIQSAPGLTPGIFCMALYILERNLEQSKNNVVKLFSKVLGKLVKVSPMTAAEKRFIPTLICLHCTKLNKANGITVNSNLLYFVLNLLIFQSWCSHYYFSSCVVNKISR